MITIVKVVRWNMVLHSFSKHIPLMTRLHLVRICGDNVDQCHMHTEICSTCSADIPAAGRCCAANAHTRNTTSIQHVFLDFQNVHHRHDNRACHTLNMYET